MPSGMLDRHTQISAPFQSHDRQQVLIAKLQVKKDHSGHACVKDVNATFYLQKVGKKSRTKIGYLYGQTIDRAMMDPRDPTQTLFVSEMLNKSTDRPMLHTREDQDLDEAEIIMQHMFHRDGTPRDQYASKLSRSREDIGLKLHWIPEFYLEPAYRGCELSRIALHSYLRGIQRFKNGHKYQGYVVLSPAALEPKAEESAATPSKTPGKTLIEVERALIGCYEKAGFAVWTKGDDEHGGLAITIMGVKITGPKIRKLSTVPLRQQEDGSKQEDGGIRRVDSGMSLAV